MTFKKTADLRCEDCGSRTGSQRFALAYLSMMCISAVVAGMIGCDSGDKPATSVLYLLDSEPVGATSITAAKEALVGAPAEEIAEDTNSDPQTTDDESAADTPSDDTEETEVAESAPPTAKTLVLAGKIDAGEFDPFDKDKAVFMLSELPDPNHASGDPEHADNCPFCKRRAAMAPKALVHLEDATGKVIASDARELLGLEAGDTIVVEGSASYDAKTNILAIHATQIFKR